MVSRSGPLGGAASVDRGAANVNANDTRHADIYSRSRIGMLVVMDRS